MVEVGDLNPGAEKCLGWTSTVLFLATFAVALRFWSRLKGRKVGADDWTILAGLALNWCFSVETLVGCSVGLAGFHLTQLTVPQIELNLKIQYANQMLYAITLAMVKFSILLLYRRIFTSPKFLRSTIVMGVIVFAWMIAVEFGVLFQCVPLAGAWDLVRMKTAHCINRNSFYRGISIASLITDVLILLMPFPVIWGLNNSIKRKLSLCALFALGSFVCIASILRILYLGPFSQDPQDTTYNVIPLAIWTELETCLAIVAACIPTLPHLFQDLHQRVRSYVIKSGGSGSHTRYSQRSPRRGFFSQYSSAKPLTEDKLLRSDHDLAELGVSGFRSDSASPVDLYGYKPRLNPVPLEPVTIRKDVFVSRESFPRGESDPIPSSRPSIPGI